MSPLDNPVLLVQTLCSMPAETEWIEFKENNADPVQIGRDICALSNAAAMRDVRYAYKLWGVNDQTHAIVGTTFDPLTATKGNQALELWLRLKLSANIQFEFETVPIENKRVVLLRIWPAMYYIGLFDQKPYIRSGSSTHELKRGSAQEIELWRKVQSETYEEHIALDNLELPEALDKLDYQTYFSKQGMVTPDKLDTIAHFLVQDDIIQQNDDGTWAITNLGALLFARSLPECGHVARKALRVMQYEGTGRIKRLREQVINEGYAVCLDRAIDYIMALIPAHETITLATRSTHEQLPTIAIREIVANALIHQDLGITGAGPMVEVFSNRVEVTNPGAPLVDPMRIVNDPPHARNEKMAALMRRLGLCEEAGSGWDKVIEACEYYKLPAPRIDTPDNSTQVTLFAEVPFRDMMPEERNLACYWHACIQYANKTAATNQSLRERFNLPASSSAQVSRVIRSCIDQGLIRPLDKEASRKNMRYVPAWV